MQECPRQVDPDPFEVAAHLLDEALDAFGAKAGVARNILLGGQNGEPVRFRQQRAGHEQAVQTSRIAQRFQQPAGRHKVQRQRGGAVLDVEIDQRSLVIELLGHDPGAVYGDGTGADTAAGADYDNELAERARIALVNGGVAHRRGQQRRFELVGIDRLDQIVGHSGRNELLVEAKIVDRTERHYLGRWRAAVGEHHQVFERLLAVAEIDDENFRCARRGKKGARRAQAAGGNDRAWPVQADDLFDQRPRRLVGDEGCKRCCRTGTKIDGG